MRCQARTVSCGRRSWAGTARIIPWPPRARPLSAVWTPAMQPGAKLGRFSALSASRP